MTDISLKKKIQALAKVFETEIISVRQYIHAHPELSKQEINTSEFVSKKLLECGIKHTKGIAKTGVVGIIEGKNPSSRVVALRADMDALPINEENDIPYKSTNTGVMHACGHDAHVACLLGAAKILNELKQEWEGTVKLLFQPSEEKYPGGAITMINEGVLDNPKVDYIIAQHVFPNLKVGKVGMKKGRYMASTDEIYITVKGKGGHAATPNLNIDPIVIASHIVIALQQIVSRSANPTTPSVLSFGKFIGNGITNIIPDEVNLAGTFRTYDEVWRLDAHKKITKMATTIAESMGATCSVRIDSGYPFLINDDSLTEFVQNNSVDYLGTENVVELEMRMTSEDFSYFSQHIPACFIRLGSRNEEKNIISNLHTSTFNIDEQSLIIGSGLMAWLAVKPYKK